MSDTEVCFSTSNSKATFPPNPWADVRHFVN